MSALRPRLLGQDGVCLARVHDLHQHVQRATVHAEGNRERCGLLCVALQLGLLRAAAAPSGLMHREEAARGLVDVHDAVCADSVLLHEPAELDEEAVRVGLLLSRAVELLQAVGGLLEAQAHATQEPPYPLVAGTHVEPLCVEPLAHQAVDRDRAQAQDVGHLHDVLAQSRRVCGRQHASPAKRCCSWRAPLPTIRSVRVDLVEHSGAQALDLAQAPPHVPSPLGSPLVQHVEEPVAGDGVDVDLAALGSAAAGPVFDGHGGGTRRPDVGELLVCDRPVDGLPGRHQAGRCKRMPCGSSWWFMMCSCRARSQSCCRLGRPRGVFVNLSGGQLKPTDRAMAARSARTSSTGCNSCCEEEREDRKRFIGMRGRGKNTFA